VVPSFSTLRAQHLTPPMVVIVRECECPVQMVAAALMAPRWYPQTSTISWTVPPELLYRLVCPRFDQQWGCVHRRRHDGVKDQSSGLDKNGAELAVGHIHEVVESMRWWQSSRWE